MSLLSLRGVKRLYQTGGETVAALDGVDLDLEEGQVTLLLGPSGSGKTTLLNVVAALDEPTAGTYTFQGTPVPRSDVEAMTTFRRANIGYIFQFFNLLEDLTVLENLLLVQQLAAMGGGGRHRRRGPWTSAPAGATGEPGADRARRLLAEVGLAGLEDRFPAELSGGQQQRVAIARSLAKRPRLLLGDEPTGNLDTATSRQVMTSLVEACRAEGLTALIVTHDTSLTRYADRVIRMDSGRLVGDGPGPLAGTVAGVLEATGGQGEREQGRSGPQAAEGPTYLDATPEGGAPAP